MKVHILNFPKVAVSMKMVPFEELLYSCGVRTVALKLVFVLDAIARR